MILSYNDTEKLFSDYGLSMNEQLYADFSEYARLLTEWNEKINLTAITDAEGITVKHFLDSAIPLKYVDFPDNASLIDVGTGAGFPGIPLKIIRNDLRVTLLDSLNKRVNFLKDVSEQLKLGMNCVHARAEDGGRMPELRGMFDFSCARAVASLPALCEYCLPYVKIGGKFLALKGPNENYRDAYTAYKTLGAEIGDVISYELPGGDKRQLIIFDKIKDTPAKYPRNAAQMAKKLL